VDSAYAGNIVHVEDQEMFLKRKDILEETFFTWSMIPLRGISGTVEGVSTETKFWRTNCPDRLESGSLMGSVRCGSSSLSLISIEAMPSFPTDVLQVCTR
jgi:hypothetical protein